MIGDASKASKHAANQLCTSVQTDAAIDHPAPKFADAINPPGAPVAQGPA